jgi:hypothetical protein
MFEENTMIGNKEFKVESPEFSSASIARFQKYGMDAGDCKAKGSDGQRCVLDEIHVELRRSRHAYRDESGTLVSF